MQGRRMWLMSSWMLAVAALAAMAVFEAPAARAAPAPAESPPDAQLAQWFLTLRAESRERVIDGAALSARAREGLALGLAHIPDERRTLHVIFGEGRSAAGIETLLRHAKVDLHEIGVAVDTAGGRRPRLAQDALLDARGDTLADRIVNAFRADDPAVGRFEVFELGLIGSVRELSRLSRSLEGATLVYKPSEFIAASVDARLECRRREPRDCDWSIQDVVAGPPTPPAEVAWQTAEAYFATTDREVIAEKIAAADVELRQAASQTPSRKVAAHVLLREGAGGRWVSEHVGIRRLELSGLEASARMLSSATRFDRVYLTGPRLELGRSLEERVDMALGIERARLARSIPTGNRFEVRAYRLEVVGTLRSLDSLRSRPDVQAVIVEWARDVPQDPRPSSRGAAVR